MHVTCNCTQSQLSVVEGLQLLHESSKFDIVFRVKTLKGATIRLKKVSFISNHVLIDSRLCSSIDFNINCVSTLYVLAAVQMNVDLGKWFTRFYQRPPTVSYFLCGWVLSCLVAHFEISIHSLLYQQIQNIAYYNFGLAMYQPFLLFA